MDKPLYSNHWCCLACCLSCLLQLEGRLNEVSRSKVELESRVEEDQDEIEELLEKQRSHISHAASIQTQLAEAQLLVEEMMEVKANLESKVC